MILSPLTCTHSYRRTQQLSVPAINQLHFDALVHSYDDSEGYVYQGNQYEWTYNLWWNVWFPEALEESRKGMCCTHVVCKYVLVI